MAPTGHRGDALPSVEADVSDNARPPLVFTAIYSSERKAVATQAPEITGTGSRSLDADKELVGGMVKAVPMALGRMLVQGDRDTGARGFANI